MIRLYRDEMNHRCLFSHLLAPAHRARVLPAARFAVWPFARLFDSETGRLRSRSGHTAPGAVSQALRRGPPNPGLQPTRCAPHRAALLHVSGAALACPRAQELLLKGTRL